MDMMMRISIQLEVRTVSDDLNLRDPELERVSDAAIEMMMIGMMRMAMINEAFA